MTFEYQIFAYWGPRAAKPADCAPKAARTFHALADIDESLKSWWVGRRKDVSLIPSSSLNIDEFTALIEDGANLSEVGNEPMPEFGYRYSGFTRQNRDPRLVILRAHVGSNVGADTFANSIELETAPLGPANESIINFRVFKAALLALARVWNASWCDAAPLGLFNLLPQDKTRRLPRIRGGWLTYLAAPFASNITPPRSAAVERFPDGSLLMIATTETFRIDNPAHVAIARDIDAALAPLNALPWPPDGVRNGDATRT
jgi:hypothetical protein